MISRLYGANCKVFRSGGGSDLGLFVDASVKGPPQTSQSPNGALETFLKPKAQNHRATTMGIPESSHFHSTTRCKKESHPELCCPTSIHIQTTSKDHGCEAS